MFGAKISPNCVSYALERAVFDNEEKNPIAAQAKKQFLGGPFDQIGRNP